MFLSLLALLFIALKLCGVIAWSWLWVLAPIWIPIAVACVCGILWLLCVAIGAIAVYVTDR